MVEGQKSTTQTREDQTYFYDKSTCELNSLLL